MEILRKAALLWKNQRKDLENNGEMLADAVRRRYQSLAVSADKLDKTLLARACTMYLRQFDWKWGGFGTAPKFPAAHNLLFLMCYGRAENNAAAIRMVEMTLEAMAKGGICDHIGGGFSRYSTDDQWLVPHFEKMLYDNALLLWAYAEAYRLTEKACTGMWPGIRRIIC